MLDEPVRIRKLRHDTEFRIVPRRGTEISSFEPILPGLPQEGKTYRLTLALGEMETYAPNEFISETLASNGFTDVQVSGSGATRTAVGTWNPPPTLPRLILE